MRRVLGAALAVSILSPVTSRAAEPLQASSSWLSQASAYQCRASRAFGPVDAPVAITLEGINRGIASLTIGGKGVAIAGKKDVTLAIDGPADPPHLLLYQVPMPTGGQAFRAELFKLDVTKSDAPTTGFKAADPRGRLRPKPVAPAEKEAEFQDRLARLAQVRTLTLESGDQRLELATGSLREGFEMLARCRDGVLRRLGVDRAMEERIAQPAFVRYDDAAQSLASGNTQAGTSLTRRVRAFVRVAADGTVTECKPLETPDAAAADRFCEAIKRRKADPAETIDGTKVDSFAFLAVMY